jgi:hypothetical protein
LRLALPTENSEEEIAKALGLEKSCSIHELNHDDARKRTLHALKPPAEKWLLKASLFLK